jgi:tRNA threonylcarbamoyl adenosine modification protein (Sua5/YciO/YrdC/YwlC family)
LNDPRTRQSDARSAGWETDLMAPVVIDVSNAEDLRDVVHRAVQALVEGSIVAFPTETVYGLAASPLSERGTQRLLAIKERRFDHPFALAVKSAEEAQDYVPHMGPLGERLARRCWPGPLTIVFPDAHPESLLRQLPELAQQAVGSLGTIGLRVPAHRLILDALRLLAGPLLLTSANRPGQAEAVTALEVTQALASDVHLVLDDGPCRYRQPSTVVRVSGKEWTMLREGVISAAALQQFASVMILFVCTGNTCRSPMAEAIFRDLLARRLGTTADRLEERGISVQSAGTSALAGSPASSEAVQVMSQWGLDLSHHESQPLSAQLVRNADYIFALTRAHRQAIFEEWPEAAARTRLLSHEGRDISDPVGGPLELYRRCAEQIRAELENWAQEIEL